MACGEPVVDKQHRELIRMINQMHEAAAEGKGRKQAVEFLAFLGDYVVRHFAYEEGAMARCRCPAAEKNKAAHKAFLAKFADIDARARAEGVTLPLFIDIQTWCSDWLQAHICSVDVQLRDSLPAAPR
jgi:hemerythrin